MPMQVYEKIIKNSKGRLVISGGEPILSRSFYSILGMIKKNKNVKEVELQSNGAILYYEKIIDKIEKFKVITEYNINFPAHEKELDKKITKSDLFEFRIKGINNLLKKSLKVRLTFVINKNNYQKMKEYFKFINKTFGNKVSVQLSYIQFQGNANKGKIIVKYNEIKPYLISAIEFSRKNGMNCAIDNIPLCICFPFIEENIDFYKTKAKGISLYKKIKMKKCENCDLKENCFGPPEDYIKKFGIEEFMPIKNE
jgi:MoaA/NifB/PqqE/SkfB family radical SAM enzyme